MSSTSSPSPLKRLRVSPLQLSIGGAVLLIIVLWHTSGSFSLDLAGLDLPFYLPTSGSSALAGSSKLSVAPGHAGAVSTAPGELYDGNLDLLLNALDALEARPVRPYAEALEANSRPATCAGRDAQQNHEQYARRAPMWESLDEAMITIKKADLVDAAKRAFGIDPLSLSLSQRQPSLSKRGRVAARQEPTIVSNDELAAAQASTSEDERPVVSYGEGRGIVFTAGNANTLERVWVSIRILRGWHGCTLPIEVFGYAEELETTEAKMYQRRIAQYGDVTFRQLQSTTKEESSWKNFQTKGEAVLRSSFAEVLYLDSDNIALTDPTFLFEHPVYQERGAVFWPDFHKEGPANPIWRILDMPCRRDAWALESGQMLVNKRGQSGMNLAALVLAEAMQKDHEFWFQISEGDKDTFRYGFWALGIDYTPAMHWSSTLGTRRYWPKDGHTFCGLSIVQYALSPEDWVHFPQAYEQAADAGGSSDASASVDGAPLAAWHAPPLFVHSNLLKHSKAFRRGEVFRLLKRARDDRVARPGADADSTTEAAGQAGAGGGARIGAMDEARAAVYETAKNGLCLDVWEAFDPARDGASAPREGGDFENGSVVIEDVGDAFAGVLDDFRKVWLEAGGRIGGWSR